MNDETTPGLPNAMDMPARDFLARMLEQMITGRTTTATLYFDVTREDRAARVAFSISLDGVKFMPTEMDMLMPPTAIPDPCPTCGGAGQRAGDEVPCPSCNGSGIRTESSNEEQATEADGGGVDP